MPDSTERPSRTPAEWITFGIATAILAAIAGLVSYAWVTERDRPPVLVINRTEAVREAEGQFYVPFEVANTGGETVESVQIVAELRVNDRVEEAGDQQIDFLSGGETEEGAFVFR
ncbi:TIGR02588 family protein, partial [Leptolyngbya sp. FACHB-36]|uniref:TIGR02588 family protein n=1 Tax=Leptolyngbya sp. FACHB-36 TaxID=2692808 RepID=UPI001680B43C